MKDGVLLRQVVNAIDEIDFTDYKENTRSMKSMSKS